jgi:hypothetical protein
MKGVDVLEKKNLTLKIAKVGCMLPERKTNEL